MYIKGVCILPCRLYFVSLSPLMYIKGVCILACRFILSLFVCEPLGNLTKCWVSPYDGLASYTGGVGGGEERSDLNS